MGYGMILFPSIEHWFLLSIPFGFRSSFRWFRKKNTQTKPCCKRLDVEKPHLKCRSLSGNRWFSSQLCSIVYPRISRVLCRLILSGFHFFRRFPKLAGGHSFPELQKSMDWFKGKSTGKPWFLPSNIGVSCKFSHHPILWRKTIAKRPWTRHISLPKWYSWPFPWCVAMRWSDGN